MSSDLDFIPYHVWAVLAAILALGLLGVAVVFLWLCACFAAIRRRPRVELGRFLPEVLD
jgi:O-antigen ligase